MTLARDRSRKGYSPITQADEPRSYDRRFYARALLVGFLIIIIAIGAAVYAFGFKTKKRVGPLFDLSSLYMTGSRIVPDTHNPCVILQEYLEALRSGSFRRAYDFLCVGLKKEVTYEAFVSNAKNNEMLFRDVSAYDRSRYDVNGTAAGAEVYVEYRTGRRSRVEAAFAREGTGWKISQMTVIFQ